jgi:hypothetical protein
MIRSKIYLENKNETEIYVGIAHGHAPCAGRVRIANANRNTRSTH